jgi:hypothetical protein
MFSQSQFEKEIRKKMFRNLFFAVTVLVLGSVAASADVFTFNVDYCTNPCLGGVAANNNGGTVTITPDGTTTDSSHLNILDVQVQLNTGIDFHGAMESFAFNISGDPTLTLDTAPGPIGDSQVQILTTSDSQWSFTSVGTMDDGAGTFDYGFTCNKSSGNNGNNCATPTTTLEFLVDVSSLPNLAPSNLELLGSAKVDFGASVTNPNGPGSSTTGCTGMIGAGNGTGASTAATTNVGSTACAAPTQLNATPEPTSILLLGSVLVLVGKVLKNRLAV